MEWIIPIVALAATTAFLLIKRRSVVPEEIARQHLANKALVIDVRSAEEYRADRVPGAINIPLGELTATLPQRVSDKNQVLLVHCLSGVRSGIARQQLKAIGYQNAFNLGSLGRARAIVSPKSAA